MTIYFIHQTIFSKSKFSKALHIIKWFHLIAGNKSANDIIMVNVSSFCDFSILWKLILPIVATNNLQYSIVLKHFSYVNKLSMLNYECRYPIWNQRHVVILCLALKYRYFESCALDLRHGNICFSFFFHPILLHTKLPLSSIHEPGVEVALIFIFFDPIDDQSMFDL